MQAKQSILRCRNKRRVPGKELNEFEAINQSNTEFKIMVIRMLKELSKNYKEP